MLCVVETELLRLAIAVRRWVGATGYAMCDWISATMAPLPPLG